MRIASFLPSATEILFALGAADDVVAVTFECDFPAAARAKPQVVHSHLPPGLPPAEIDAIVRSAGAEGRSLYFADFTQLETLAPGLILLQDLCHVCAIDSPTLARDVSRLPSRPDVLSLSGHTLEGVFGDILLVGKACGRAGEAAALVAALRERVEAVRRAAKPAVPPRVLCLEWLDPLFQGGHWVPEMTLLAGGDPILAKPGEKSVQIAWDDVLAADPEIVVVMPCGYHLQETVEQFHTASTAFPAGWKDLSTVRNGKVFAVDGTSYFSRPGPRLIDGLEILHAVINHLDFNQLPPDSIQQIPA